MKRFKLVAVFSALALVFAACTSDDGEGTTTEAASGTTEAAPDTTEGSTETTVDLTQGEESVLDAVIARGELNCGTRDALPGFAVLTDDGDHVGFDSDFCRVIAAAVLGDAGAVNHVDLETSDRFTALQSGQIDVLVRNTTWTASRDGNESANFVTTTYYDGQGMMVASDSGFESTADMDGVIVCVAKGTTTEGNAAAEATRLGVDWEVRPFDDTDLIQEAFLAGQCDGWSSDTSQLVGLRSVYPDGADALTILPEVFSKEPLGPAVLDGDTQWAQAVNWAVLATIQAEEWGITSGNVDDFLTSEDSNIVKFLGGEFETDDGTTILDPGIGLPTDFAYQVISQVGNYGEIFEANLTPLGLQRGPNALWFDGGLMYAPPYR
ncbi:MAG: amino acid ABC transporter substrate-binding protein [Acidimicrobiia bacterium]|jgi:general L-amino acid transport system substrate-binding protein